MKISRILDVGSVNFCTTRASLITDYVSVWLMIQYKAIERELDLLDSQVI